MQRFIKKRKNHKIHPRPLNSLRLELKKFSKHYCCWLHPTTCLNDEPDAEHICRIYGACVEFLTRFLCCSLNFQTLMTWISNWIALLLLSNIFLIKSKKKNALNNTFSLDATIQKNPSENSFIIAQELLKSNFSSLVPSGSKKSSRFYPKKKCFF